MSSSSAKFAIFIVISSLVSAHATSLDTSDYVEEGEERTIFTSGGTYYLALNTTYLLLYSLLLGGLLLGALFLTSGVGGASASSSGYGQQYGGYQQKTGQDYQNFNRNKRESDYDFTEQLNRLAEAFHKYEIDEAQGCQLYVACESSNVAQHYKNGPLAKTVHHVMRTIALPENRHLYEDDKYLLDILQAYKSGSEGNSCEYFRKQCRKDKVFSI